MIPDLTYGPEWALLELACLDVREPENETAFRNIVQSGTLNWGRLIEQAIRHKVLPLLADSIIRTCQSSGTDNDKEVHLDAQVPVMIAKHLLEVLQANRHKTHIFRAQAIRIGAAITAAGVPWCATKGISYESVVYGGTGVRNFDHDIDFMIRAEDGETVTECFRQLGYTVGQYDPFNNQLKPLPRKELVTYKLNPDHLLPHAFFTGDCVAPCVGADVAFSFTWYNSVYEVPLQKAFEKTDTVHYAEGESGTLNVFRPEYQFLFTTLHLFREAWFSRYIAFQQDVNLLKFTDLIRLWKHYRETLVQSQWGARVTGFGVAEPVAWVLEHLDRAFGLHTINELGLRSAVKEENLFAADGGIRWRGSMRERLFTANAAALRVE